LDADGWQIAEFADSYLTGVLRQLFSPTSQNKNATYSLVDAPHSVINNYSEEQQHRSF